MTKAVSGRIRSPLARYLCRRLKKDSPTGSPARPTREWTVAVVPRVLH